MYIDLSLCNVNAQQTKAMNFIVSPFICHYTLESGQE